MLNVNKCIDQIKIIKVLEKKYRTTYEQLKKKKARNNNDKKKRLNSSSQYKNKTVIKLRSITEP